MQQEDMQQCSQQNTYRSSFILTTLFHNIVRNGLKSLLNYAQLYRALYGLCA